MLMAVLTVAYISMDGWWTAVGDRLYFAYAHMFVAALFSHRSRDAWEGNGALPFADIAVCIVGGLPVPGDVQLHRACCAMFRPAFVLMPFVIAFIGDSFSMLGGMAFGHKEIRPARESQ